MKKFSRVLAFSSLFVFLSFDVVGFAQTTDSAAPVPLLTAGQPVSWFFVYKFNKESFPGSGSDAKRTCTFGGSVMKKEEKSGKATTGDQFVYASNINPALTKGDGVIGDGTGKMDPVGATFSEIYHGKFNYVVWNDQPLANMKNIGCGGKSSGGSPEGCPSPWGHSKGVLVWDNQGNGMILQTTTPGWPASPSKLSPSKVGDTLGCGIGSDNLSLAQDFFALKLDHAGVVSILKALQNSSVVTNPDDPTFVHNGGPVDIQALVKNLGVKNKGTDVLKTQLTNNIELISKPSALQVPPWQFVSAELGGIPLRAATFWGAAAINTTTSTTPVTCWDKSLGQPGPVEIATTGSWGGTPIQFGFKFNHGKVGVSLDSKHPFTIFGDMNQQGTLVPQQGDCSSAQNGRGGLFFVVNNPVLWGSVSNLLKGDSAPTP